MSLDVYLIAEQPVPKCGSGIFVRENGRTVEISAEEWNERHPEAEPIQASQEYESCELYSRNITHNLGKMASEAGLYKWLWRPDENGIEAAGQLVPHLREGLGILLTEPERFEQLNPSNGWGDYRGLVDFVTDYLIACARHPTAKVEVSR